jgi:acetoin utilization deacetylase AcuC-like enzyme
MLIYSHAACDGHVTPPGHPERVERLAAVRRGLAGVAGVWRDCPPAAEADLLRAHPQAHLDRLARPVAPGGWAQVDGDTFLAPGSERAARLAAGGACAAVDAVLAGEGATAFVAARPPGHHAERDRAMGFCLYSTVAIAALRALHHHGLARVAVLDFDVHHGNGTQDVLWDEGGCLFASSHQMPLYPGTGSPSERGAQGQILNLPLREGSGGGAMRAAWGGTILPRVRDFAPQLILVSAGFDAHEDDPLAGLCWQAADYAWLGRAIARTARAVAGGRVVSCLEGGYDLPALEAAVAAYAQGIEGGEAP